MSGKIGREHANSRDAECPRQQRPGVCDRNRAVQEMIAGKAGSKIAAPVPAKPLFTIDQSTRIASSFLGRAQRLSEIVDNVADGLKANGNAYQLLAEHRRATAAASIC